MITLNPKDDIFFWFEFFLNARTKKKLIIKKFKQPVCQDYFVLKIILAFVFMEKKIEIETCWWTSRTYYIETYNWRKNSGYKIGKKTWLNLIRQIFDSYDDGFFLQLDSIKVIIIFFFNKPGKL